MRSTLVLEFLLICVCFGADIYYNTSTPCPPPTGCDFMSPDTWINGTVPLPSNSDRIFITTQQQDNSNVLVVISNLVGPTPIPFFEVASISITNATVIVQQSWVFLDDYITIQFGQLFVQNSSVVAGDEVATEHAQIYVLDDSTFGPNDLPLSATGTILLYDSSSLLVETAIINGAIYAYNGSKISFSKNCIVYGLISSNSSYPASFGTLTFKTNSSVTTINRLVVSLLLLEQGVTLIVSYSVVINYNLTLSQNTELHLVNIPFNITNGNTIPYINVVGGGINTTLTLNTAHVFLGSPSGLDLSNVVLQMGNSSLFAISLAFGQIVSKSFNGIPADSLIFIGSSSIFTQSTSFTGDIIISSIASLSIKRGITLSIASGCLENYGYANIFGSLVCTTPGSQVITTSFPASTYLYGNIVADNIVFTDSAELIPASNYTNLQAQSVIFNNSILLLDPSITLTVVGNLILSGSKITTDVTHPQQVNTSMVQVIGIVNITSVNLQANASGNTPTQSQVYNLLNSSSPINGIIGTSNADVGSLSLKYPSANQIAFEYIPPTSKDWDLPLPLWALVAIGLGTIAAIIVIVILLAKNYSKKQKYQRI